jgi:protein-S-isoprenylcysteine O-methyltransferase Ste14
LSTLTIYLLSIPLLIGFSIIVLRVIVRRDYLRRGHLSIGSAALQALVFFLFGGFPAIYLSGDWPISQVSLIPRIIGLSCLSIGLGIMLIGILRLGFLRSLGMQSGVLKVTSVYRLTRNPQVLGCLLYVIGFTILWPSLYALGWGLSLTAILHVMVLTEEEHLRNTYGQDYDGYCNSAPRYLGYPKVIK